MADDEPNNTAGGDESTKPSKEELEAEQQAAKEQLQTILDTSRPKHLGYGISSGVSNIVAGAVGAVGVAILAPVSVCYILFIKVLYIMVLLELLSHQALILSYRFYMCIYVVILYRWWERPWVQSRQASLGEQLVWSEVPLRVLLEVLPWLLEVLFRVLHR